MIRFAISLVLLLLCTPAVVQAQSSPNWSRGYVPSAGEVNSAFSAKQDRLQYTPLNQSGGSMTGKLQTAPATINGAGFALLPGIAPTTPANGDLWSTSQGFFGYINGSVVSLAGSSTSTGAVRYDQSQSLTTGQRLQARANSGVIGSGYAYNPSFANLSPGGTYFIDNSAPASYALPVIGIGESIRFFNYGSSTRLFTVSSPKSIYADGLSATSLTLNPNETIEFFSFDGAGSYLAISHAAPLTSPAFLGSPTAPTPTAGDNSAKVATTAYADRAATAVASAGAGASDDCARLSIVSGTSLQVAPVGCNTIVIGGVPRPLTTATVSNSATTFGTLYYGYASWSGSAVSLTLSTTGHVTGSDGREYQSSSGAANTASRYVGMVYTAGTSGTGTFVDSPTQRYVATWSKRIPRPLLGSSSAGTSGSSTPVESNSASRVYFISHADEMIDLETGGAMSNNTGNQGISIYPGLDGNATGPGNYYQDSAASVPGPAVSRSVTLASEGLHYGTVMFKAGGGSATVSASVVGVIR